MTRILSSMLASLALAACSGDPGEVSRVAQVSLELPQAKSFGSAPAPATNISNAELARDFLALTFELESGRALPVMARFEGPITVRLTGKAAPSVTSRDLDLLIARLRREAGIDISRVGAGEAASITVALVALLELRRAVPRAACFVAPSVSSWADFLRQRNSSALDWTALDRRTEMAVFVPAGVSAQETRDCLHEEIAQALGPVNDLYSLTDSVFNDDNFHTILTGFDMSVLRLFYDRDLASGMSRGQVVGRLTAILARQRPGAARSAIRPDPGGEPGAWKAAIETALGANSRPASRLGAARRAVNLARAQGWQDNRLAFSLYAYGRLSVGSDPARALTFFAEAEALFRGHPDTRIHAAHVAVQTAAFALSSGRARAALDIVDANTAIARRAQNAGLLATLLLIKASALDALQRSDDAVSVRLEALGWARYAFVSEAEIRDRLQEIGALAQSPDDGGTS